MDKFRKIGIAFILILLSAILVSSFSEQVTNRNPGDGVYLSDTVVDFNFTLYIDIEKPLWQFGLSNFHLYGNWTGTWEGNETQANFTSGDTVAFTSINLTDGVYLWNVQYNQTNSSALLKNISDYTYSFIMDLTSPIVTLGDNLLVVNESYITDSTPTLNWTQATEVNFEKYFLETSDTKDFSKVGQNRTINAKTTITDTFENDLNESKHYWRVTVVDKAGLRGSSDIAHFTIDKTSPTTPSLVTPTDASYSTTTTVNFVGTTTETNIANCTLLYNSTGITLVEWINTSNATSYLNVSMELADGTHYWGVKCYDYATHSATSSTYSVIVDTLDPDKFSLTSSLEAFNRSTDFTPTFKIRNVTALDTNFNSYIVYVGDTPGTANSGGNYSLTLDMDDYNAGYFTETINRLDFWDETWYYAANVTDLAGNTNISANGTLNFELTSHSCAKLYTGWNACGWVRDGSPPANLSSIGGETGATAVAIWNSSHMFQTWVNGSTTNDDLEIVRGDVVYLYVVADTYWEDTEYSTNSSVPALTLTNTTNEYNLVMHFGNWSDWSGDFSILDNNIGHGGTTLNYTSYSFYNNSAGVNSRFIDFFSNISYNENTSLYHGDPVWIISEGVDASKTFARDGWEI